MTKVLTWKKAPARIKRAAKGRFSGPGFLSYKKYPLIL